MRKYFNLLIEFDNNKIDNIIEDSIKYNYKGYVCAIDGNVISTAQNDLNYQNDINGALVNICDSSYIPLYIKIKMGGKKLQPYIAEELFIKYIKEKKCSFYFLGNTEEVLIGLKQFLLRYNKDIKNSTFESLPFKNVEDFSYESIAKNINKVSPDIIWVSLGAPKQDKFMSRLLPFLNKGIMFGIGAAFDFYSVSGKGRAPKLFRYFKIEWFYRLITEPKRMYPRFIANVKFAFKVLFKLI